MLTNSDKYLCSNYKSGIQQGSSLVKLNSVPTNFIITSSSSYIFMDNDQGNTYLLELQLTQNKQQKKVVYSINQIQQFIGEYYSWDMCNDGLLLLNRTGDVLFYNLLTKNIFSNEKQHPGLYSPVKTMHTNEHFISCGGSVKNNLSNQNQSIIKVWSHEKDDKLNQQARISTGHSKAIQCSFIHHNCSVVTSSFDHTIRTINLCKQQIDSVIAVDFHIFAGCSIDYNCIIMGGITNNLKIYDLRTNRNIKVTYQVPEYLVQINTIQRFTDHQMIFTNINQIYTLDLRNMHLNATAKYQGQRISHITVISQKYLVAGNRDKNMQIWRSY